MKNFHVAVDSDGIACVTWDMPERPVNVVNDALISDLESLINNVKADTGIKGVVLTSAKEGFCAGGDLVELDQIMRQARGLVVGMPEMATLYQKVYKANLVCRALETCGKPVVAALNGFALGGGLEVALACHFRVAVDNPHLRIGLPESTIGLLPGGGGTQRLPRLIGLERAIPLMLEGKSVSPAEALKLGIIHQVVPESDLISAARKWILTCGDATQPWDKRGYRIPNGDPLDLATANYYAAANARLSKTTYGNYPAQNYILQAVYEGSSASMDVALGIESRYFTMLLCRPEAQGMVRTLFFSKQALTKSARRPKNEPHWAARKIGILGAGLMGSGISYAAANSGVDVVLLDTSREIAKKGKDYTKNIVSKNISRGAISDKKAEEIIGRINPTDSYKDFLGVDLIIEAVFESRQVKEKVISASESYLADGGVFASNTSTLPISGLAKSVQNPEYFIGMHFFSPVEKMELVELILGEKTSNGTLAKAMDFVSQIRKTPIIVNDARGFYTSRVFATYIHEGMRMLTEGVDPILIENSGKHIGMPVSPLMLSDAVGLDLAARINQQTQTDLGDKYVPGPAHAVLETMVLKYGRNGRSNGKGFYDYTLDGDKVLWSGLRELFPLSAAQPNISLLKDRLLFIQVLEAVRCYADGVITDIRDIDVGAILGWNFARYTGGPISFIEGMGIDVFIERCIALADLFGERFLPPLILNDMAAKKEMFYAA